MASKSKKKSKKKAPASKSKKKAAGKKTASKKTKAVKKKKAGPKKKAVKKKTVKKAAKKKTAPKKKASKKKTANKKPAKKAVKKSAKKASRKKTSKAAGKTSSQSDSSKKKLVVQKHDPSKLDPIIAKIRNQLISERNELLKMIQSSQEVERNVGDLTFSNEIDLASSLEGREMAFQLSSRERNELKMIEEALFRIKTGTYGVCEGCSRNIGTKRLQIMPLTALCIECQESLEVG